jgi:hypothetical protein
VSRPALGLLAVVALLAGGTFAVSSVDAPAQRRAGAQQVEVVGATAVCPDVRQDPGRYQTRISVGAAPLPEGRTASGGQVDATQLAGGSKATPIPVTEPGQVAVDLGTTIDENGVVVNATGQLAAGLEVEQVARVNDGRFRGLASIRCEAPKRDAWFVGASTGLADFTVLVMANVDDTPATVDVSAFGRSGGSDPRVGQGLTIAPHSRTVLALDTITPDSQFLVLHVRSRQGRVVAALRDARFSSGTPLGFDYVPQAQPPATTTVVPGFPAGPGFRGVIVGNPSDDDTTVSLQVTVKDGQFVPAGFDEVRVPARKSAMVDITSLTNAGPVTVKVTSSGAPVVAGGFLLESQQFQLGGIRESAYAGSSAPLSGPALLTDLVIDRPTESTLILTAPEEAATVVVTPITVLGSKQAPPPAKTLTVPAGRTIAFRMSTFFPPGTQAKLAVEVRAQDGSGPVYATRYLRERGGRGTLATLLTLQGPARLVPRPATVQDDEAAYP